jgi:hypothetical protein
MERPQQEKSHRRVQQAQYHTTGGSFQLESLPRFHPAAYTSSNSSSRTSTPNSACPTPGPLSARSQSRIQEPQRHLSVYHQTLLAQYAARDFAAAGGSPGSPQHLNVNYKPPSPKLLPLGSPGAVTPLELEGDNYLSAGGPSGQQDRLSVDSYIQKEAKRSGDVSPRRLTAV